MIRIIWDSSDTDPIDLTVAPRLDRGAQSNKRARRAHLLFCPKIFPESPSDPPTNVIANNRWRLAIRRNGRARHVGS